MLESPGDSLPLPKGTTIVPRIVKTNPALPPRIGQGAALVSAGMPLAKALIGIRPGARTGQWTGGILGKSVGWVRAECQAHQAACRQAPVGGTSASGVSRSGSRLPAVSTRQRIPRAASSLSCSRVHKAAPLEGPGVTKNQGKQKVQGHQGKGQMRGVALHQFGPSEPIPIALLPSRRNPVREILSKFGPSSRILTRLGQCSLSLKIRGKSLSSAARTELRCWRSHEHPSSIHRIFPLCGSCRSARTGHSGHGGVAQAHAAEAESGRRKSAKRSQLCSGVNLLAITS